jgi:hypothetical protein
VAANRVAPGSARNWASRSRQKAELEIIVPSDPIYLKNKPTPLVGRKNANISG